MNQILSIKNLWKTLNKSYTLIGANLRYTIFLTTLTAAIDIAVLGLISILVKFIMDRDIDTVSIYIYKNEFTINNN